MSANSDNPIENTVSIGKYGNLVAKPGFVWQCGACGKISQDRYGNQPISRGWDESCALNCVLVRDPRPST